MACKIVDQLKVEGEEIIIKQELHDSDEEKEYPSLKNTPKDWDLDYERTLFNEDPCSSRNVVFPLRYLGRKECCDADISSSDVVSHVDSSDNNNVISPSHLKVEKDETEYSQEKLKTENLVVHNKAEDGVKSVNEINNRNANDISTSSCTETTRKNVFVKQEPEETREVLMNEPLFRAKIANENADEKVFVQSTSSNYAIGTDVIGNGSQICKMKINGNQNSQTSGEDDSQSDAPSFIQLEAIQDIQTTSGDGDLNDPQENIATISKENKRRKYICEFCNKAFMKWSGLHNHKVIHTGETPYRCTVCNKQFNVRSNLNVHLRIHTGQKPHVCEFCHKSFCQAGQLKHHLRVHNGEKPYPCNFCKSAFRSSSSLVIHLRTHTGEKPFQCKLCSRSFATSTSLKTHLVTHSGQQLFDCPLCDKKFNRKNNLNVHIKRHNKDRNFSCHICNNGFVMRAHLINHLRRTHNILMNDNNENSDSFTDTMEKTVCVKMELVDNDG